MNSKSRACIRKSVQFFSSIFLIILIAALASPGAMACHRVDKNGNPKPHGKDADCGGNPDTFPSVEEKDTSAFFGDPQRHVESNEVFFIRQGLTTDSGDFVLDDSTNPDIVIDTAQLSKLQLKGRTEICRQLENNTTGLRPDEFSYGWVDDCTDGDCAVEIRLVFTQGVSELTEGESDRVDFLMEAVVSNPDSYHNPFVVEQELRVVRMQADYKKPGTTRTSARCQWTQAGADVPRFHSFPRN